jgi:2',3'-cyclic-nucleotide 2'-phosphodiesterase (5'-nucleotidase family)
LARWATFINRSHDPNANWLTVDCGNYVDRAGANGGCTSKCAFMISSYEDLYYDVLNIGRQEVWMGYETIKALQDSAKKGTQFVSANLLDKKSEKPIVKPYVIKDYGNMRVAVVGLMNDADFPPGSTSMDSIRFKVAPYIEAAKKYIPSLARSNDAVILLAELSSQAIDSLLKVVPEIDLIISSGALRSGETSTTVGKTRIMGPGSSGYNGHYTMLEFNPSWKDSVAFVDASISLDDTYDETGKWADRLAAFQASPQAGTLASPPKPASLSPTTAPTTSPVQPTERPSTSTSASKPAAG